VWLLSKSFRKWKSMAAGDAMKRKFGSSQVSVHVVRVGGYKLHLQTAFNAAQGARTTEHATS